MELALRQALPTVDVNSLRALPGGTIRKVSLLALMRPNLVIAEAFGREALAAALYRASTPASRLLLCAAEPPERFGRVERFVLGHADGLLADGEDVVRAVERLRLPQTIVYPKPLPADLDLFLAGPPQRDGARAHRLLHVGPLSPESGAADVLIALAAWAEQHAEREVEIWWAGDGDLAGVLEAQPLPPNLNQRFLGEFDRRGLPEIFTASGIMVVPLADGEHRQPVVEAMAAGVLVLGNRRASPVRRVARAGGPVWAFDALGQPDLAVALDEALQTTPDELNAMREAGRMLVRGARSGGFAEHVREAIAAVLPPSRMVPDGAFP